MHIFLLHIREKHPIVSCAFRAIGASAGIRDELRVIGVEWSGCEDKHHVLRDELSQLVDGYKALAAVVPPVKEAEL